MRIVQEGSGSTRPLILVYHLNEVNDDALRAAVPANATVVNDTRTYHYVDVPTLSDTVASLQAQLGALFAPVVLAGFSEGGLVTRDLLNRGANPDALVIADGTYGTDYASWTKYADAAKARTKAMLASYSAGTNQPWTGLKAITGFPLAFGSALTQPTKYADGSLAVLGYGDGDHTKQGSVVLPLMITTALNALSVSGPSASESSIKPVVAAVLITGAAAALAWAIYRIKIKYAIAQSV